jgi:hypothetical protein
MQSNKIINLLDYKLVANGVVNTCKLPKSLSRVHKRQWLLSQVDHWESDDLDQLRIERGN